MDRDFNKETYMARTSLSIDLIHGKIVFTAGGEPNVTCKGDIVGRLKEYFKDSRPFYVVEPMATEGRVCVDTDCMDPWRNAIYALSEGQIGVGDIAGTDKYKVVRRKFVTQSPETLADIVMSMLAKDLPHTHIKEAEESAVVWREATESEQRDPGIKWEMEGSSKYGRRMINRERHIYRGLTISEFYGGGVVD